MSAGKLGAAILMIVMLVAFLLVMPIVLTASTGASAQATLDGDTGAAAILNVMPIITAVAGIGVTFFIIVGVVRSR
jgi:preprotein translocase subunit SecG|tara:strand:+ start:946 stop:1173 length:228 start_codon:yes stop_codon:yes gene_type:complete